MPAWIHNRAEHILAKNPSMKKETAFAIATQQSHKLGKTPKGYGTAKGKREAKAKYDQPKKKYVKGANPGNLETPKLSDKPKTRWTGSKLVKKGGLLPKWMEESREAARRGEKLDTMGETFAKNRAFGRSLGKGILGSLLGTGVGTGLGLVRAKSVPAGIAYPILGSLVGGVGTTAAAYPFELKKQRRMQEEKREKMKKGSVKLAEEHKDQVRGGKADKAQPKDFPKDQMRMGQKVEMEHTNDPALAREIAADHLEEFDDYYSRLAKMEDAAKKAKGQEKTANGDDDEGEEGAGRAPTKGDVQAIRAYMQKRPPGEEDEEFHEFVQGRGVNVPAAEAAVYDMVGSQKKASASIYSFCDEVLHLLRV